MYQQADEARLVRAFGSTLAYHSTESMYRQLQLERSGGELVYELSTTDESMIPAMAGIVSSIAIPQFMKSMRQSQTAQADLHLQNFTRALKTYFESEQTRCGGRDDCVEPWHEGGEAGMPVPFDEYTFPGGTDATFNTRPNPPKSGNTYRATLENMKADIEGASGRRANKIMADILELGGNRELRFQYTYETGPGTGDDATATIRAVADFDSSTPKKHTVTQNLEVQNARVRIQPAYTENEFE